MHRRTQDLRRLQLAWACAAIGGWMFMVALAVHAYAAGGATAVGLAALVRMVPAGLAAPLLGHAGDRFSRRDVLLVTTLARAAVLVAASLFLHSLPALLVLAAVFTILTAAHKPAQAALLPKLTRNPARANAAWTAIDNASFVGGAIAAGAIVATAGAAAAFAAAAVTFGLAASLLARIARDAPAATHAPGRELTAGLRTIARDRRLALLVGVLSASTLIEGMVDVLVVVTALRLTDLGAAGVGWLNAAWGVGGVAGAAVALRTRPSLPAGGLLVGAPLMLLAAVPAAAPAVVLLAVLGAGYALVEVAGRTLLQRHADDHVRARAFGVVESTYWLTTGAGAMLAPPLVALVGPRTALALIGAALPATVLAYAIASRAREIPSASTSRCVTARTVEAPVAPIRTP
jgi:predicted MFS family arabinose efflux permease